MSTTMTSRTLAQLAAPLTLIERKQETVRHAICDHASKLLFQKGFHETTIDDIAKEAGIGRRTFFRYFETKEDMVLWKFDQFALRTLELLEARPRSEQGLLSLQRALTEASEFYNQEPAQTLAILQMTKDTPSLFAQQLLQQNRWKAWFAAPTFTAFVRGQFIPTGAKAG